MKYTIFILASMLGSSLFAQNSALTTLDVRKIDVTVKEEMAFQEVNGLAIGIVRNGEPVFYKGYGFIDDQKKIKVRPTTPFNWASISKTVTAVAAWQLIEKGKMRLNDKAKAVLGNAWVNAGDSNQINVSHLLSHRSGICHYGCVVDGVSYPANKNAYTDTSSDWNYRQSLDKFEDRPLFATPGDTFTYSSYAYNLLGAMIEKKSLTGYVPWVKDNIIKKLNLNSMEIAKDEWSGYQKDCNGAPQFFNENDKRDRLPGGGWRSNIRDLTKFMNGLINNDLLNDTDQMWETVRHGGKFIKNSNYRYGVKHEFNSDSTEYVIYHQGKHENVRTIMAFYPESKFGVAIMANGGYVNVMRIFNRIANEFGFDRSSAAGPLSYCETLNGCSGNVISLFSKTNNSSILRSGYDQQTLEKEIEELKLHGYSLSDVSFFVDGQLKIDAIFKRERVVTELVLGKSQSKFSDIRKQKRRNGMRLIDLEIYKQNGNYRWSGIFKTSSEQTKYYTNFAKKDFDKKRSELKQQGYQLHDVEIIRLNNENRWSALWKKGNDGAYVPGALKAPFVDRINSEAKLGRRLIDVEFFIDKGRALYLGVFEKTNKKSKFRSKSDYCKLALNLRSFAREGYELVDLERN